jgi:hypothetical protein
LQPPPKRAASGVAAPTRIYYSLPSASRPGLSGGVSYADPWLGGRYALGGGLTSIEAAEETRYGAANSALKAGWAYAVNLGCAVKW